MKIQGINYNNTLLSFTAGKSTLFTDFDGTFLAQPMYDVYNGGIFEQKEEVANWNKYFSQIQNFVEKKNGDFDIIITTGRRLDWHPKGGFIPFYKELLDFGIKFPRIKSIITSEGGDMHDFRPDGNINTTPNPQKAAIVTRLSGWENSKIKQALDKAAQETGVDYSFVNRKGNYKLSVKLSDETKAESFNIKLREIIGSDVKFKSKVSNVKEYYEDLAYTETKGIKLEPIIEGHHLHKDFDVKIALQKAIANDDFVLVAGDASNDKEMLNIFRYVDDVKAVPKTAAQITPEYVASVKDKIDALPLKIMFIKPNPDDATKLVLYEFMKKLESYFPQKVQIIEQTFPGQRNFYLEAIENAINNHQFKSLNNSKNRYWGLVAFGAAICLGIGYVIKKIFFDKNKKENEVGKTLPTIFQSFA